MRYAILMLLPLLLAACNEDVKNVTEKAKETVGKVVDKLEETGKAKCEGYIDQAACTLDTQCMWVDGKCGVK